VRAIEMEGSGILDAGWAMNTDVMVVRGICDYCDSHKNDQWQPYAALCAAAYARSLVQALPENLLRPRAG
jgi:nucleoside phosphorylase